MFVKEFRDLRRKRDKLLALPDQLNYAIPIDDFTIALKDGAFLSAFSAPAWTSILRAPRNWTPIARRLIEHSRDSMTASCTTSISSVIRASIMQAEHFLIPSAPPWTGNGKSSTPRKVSTSRQGAS